MGKSHSTGLSDDLEDEEYEYMNKQTCVKPVSPRNNSHLKDDGHRLRPGKKRTSSVSSQATACSGDFTSSIRNNQISDSEQRSQGVEYEYMDIRCNEKEAIPPARDPPPPPTKMGGEELDEEEENEYVEDSNYHYTNRQPKLRQALQDKKELKIHGGDNGEAYEYEDMDCLSALRTGDAVAYENMQRDGEGAVGRAGAHQSGFEPNVQVRAGVGVGEPAAGDSSFDNPGYWHSRMFLKPKAVPT